MCSHLFNKKTKEGSWLYFTVGTGQYMRTQSNPIIKSNVYICECVYVCERFFCFCIEFTWQRQVFFNEQNKLSENKTRLVNCFVPVKLYKWINIIWKTFSFRNYKTVNNINFFFYKSFKVLIERFVKSLDNWVTI